MIEGSPALLVLLPIAFYGALRTVQDVKGAWVHRHEALTVHKVGRVRLATWFASWFCAGLMVVDALLRGPPWIFLTGFAGIGVAWLAYLALSLYWGALGGPDN